MLRQLIHRNPIRTRSISTPSTLRWQNHILRASRASVLLPSEIARTSAFHSTPRRQGGPLIPLFAAVLKASTSLEIIRTAGRIALTFLPVILLKNRKSQIRIKYAALHGIPGSEENKELLLKRIRNRKILMYALLLVPVTLFWATIVASLERTPLTGRWRMIILSPEEEEEIATQLAGPGWYNAVGEILSQDSPPRVIPNTDWRYTWVNDVLRKLEATIPILTNEPTMYSQWLDDQQNSPPMPPPAKYPLRPRPRASEYLRWVCESICERTVQPMPHNILGPPYSLMLVDKPDSSNAFSYGFGPEGGGGIVVYSGFLNDVLSRVPVEVTQPSVEEKSWWSRLRNIFYTQPTPPIHPTPTPEQTTELAILLAHELSHLILSHHLESLSSATIIIPGTISIFADIVRVLIFPITMLFGPFVNDAVAQLGKVGSGELIKVGEYCTSVKQEIEADVVSARLLAHAGFDARKAVNFWEIRSGKIFECSDTKENSTKRASERTVQHIMGSTHPVSEVRIQRLKDELARWEIERQSHLRSVGASGALVIA